MPPKASLQAQKIIAAGPTPGADRSAQNLPKLRAELRAYIAPIARRVLADTNVQTKERMIGGIACLVVTPAQPRVDWTILYCFGGGFVTGSPDEDLGIVAQLCAMTGAQVIVPDYRIAPEHPWPAATDDGFAVYRALCHAPFAIVGESAGGNLALCLMQKARGAGLPLPAAAALMSPWCDLSNAGESLSRNDGRDPTLRRHELDLCTDHYAAQNDLSNPEISPIHGRFDPGFPPCLISTGTRDLLLSQSKRLAELLQKNGVAVDLRVWEDMWHVFEWEGQIPEARQSLTQIAQFLTEPMTRSGKPGAVHLDQSTTKTVKTRPANSRHE